MAKKRAIFTGHIPTVNASRSEVMSMARAFRRMSGIEKEALASSLAENINDAEIAKIVAPLLGSLGGVQGIGIQSSHMLLLSIFFKAMELGRIECSEP